MKSSNSKLSPPKKPLTDAPLNAIEQNMAMSVMQMLQLERTIWLLAHEAGGSVVVDEASMHPLWDVKYERIEGASKTLLKITAVELPEATEAQIRRLADLLADQPEARTPSALLEAGVAHFAPSYIVARLAPLVQCRDGVWKKV